jgi:hypothetical protein
MTIHSCLLFKFLNSFVVEVEGYDIYELEIHEHAHIIAEGNSQKFVKIQHCY